MFPLPLKVHQGSNKPQSGRAKMGKEWGECSGDLHFAGSKGIARDTMAIQLYLIETPYILSRDQRPEG